MEYFDKYESPLGVVCLKSDGEYLTGLWFENSHDEFKTNKVGDKTVQGANKVELTIFDETKKWLDIYFSGVCPKFTPKYKLCDVKI